jgi:putative polyhydroxyalkanoate system protein
MANLHILREHTLGLEAARQVAHTWGQQAQDQFGMECSYAEGPDGDVLSFSRSGLSGTLQVDAQRFELNAKLGFLLAGFKDKIEAEVVKNLDALLLSSGTQ